VKIYKNKHIKNLLNLEKYEKTVIPQTLFEPPWYAVKQGLCPLCGRRLAEMRKRKGFICRGNKHKTFITFKYYQEIKEFLLNN